MRTCTQARLPHQVRHKRVPLPKLVLVYLAKHHSSLAIPSFRLMAIGETWSSLRHGTLYQQNQCSLCEWRSQEILCVQDMIFMYHHAVFYAQVLKRDAHLQERQFQKDTS